MLTYVFTELAPKVTNFTPIKMPIWRKAKDKNKSQVLFREK
jgi:hypothetical protein